ncbi:MAG: transposase [Xanthomonadaceae bacterium]|jgi:transposase|nr:transposase [Xanthomonadaceae bacterium]
MQSISRRRYTDDFKAQAIALAEPIGPASAARQLNISVKTLSNWLTASRAGRPLRSLQCKPSSELESQLTRLRTENATLKMEPDIIKKSDGVLRQGVQVRYAFVARERTRYPTRLLCRVSDPFLLRDQFHVI